MPPFQLNPRYSPKREYRPARVQVSDAMPLEERMLLLADLEKQMKQAAQDLDFERAAELRDNIIRVKKTLPGGKKKH